MIEENDYLPLLPRGWVWTTLGEIITLEYGRGLVKSKRDPQGAFPVYGSSGMVGRHSIPLVEKPCLIVGRKGAIGSVHLSKEPCWAIDTTYYVIPPEGLDLSFLFYLLSNIRLYSFDRSTAIPGLNRDDAYAIKIPLAPFAEQGRIVAKVEELYTNLDAGVESLKNVKMQLKRYRQAVLKYAFEGRLTEEWRKTHKDQIEPAQKLLEQIKQEYTESKRGKRKELPPLGVFNLTELPEGWLWARVDWLCGVQTGPFGTQLHRSDYSDSGIPTIEIGDVHPRRNLKEGTAHFIQKDKALKLQRFEVRSGDVLFSRVGTVGRCTLVPPECDSWIMSTSLIRVRTSSKHLLPNYLLFYFWSPIAQAFALETSKGTTRAGTNSKIVGELPLIVPPLSEQYLIVEEIERQLSIADEVEESVMQNLKRTECLRLSILKKAFEGKLVRQDPTDEPAEKLLGRIKEERMSHMIKEGVGKRKVNNVTPKEVGLMRYVE